MDVQISPVSGHKAVPSPQPGSHSWAGLTAGLGREDTRTTKPLRNALLLGF